MNIAVIGAGATGLAAAYDLAGAGHAVTVIEASDAPGGLAGGFRMPGWRWSLEKFYHHWFASDRDVLRLADELGVRNKVIFKRPITVSYHNGAFYPLDSPQAVLRFPGLPPMARVRLGLVVAYLKFGTNNWRALERWTAEAWCRRWMGNAAYEAVWQPLLEGKFGAHHTRVNMAWLWARIKARTPKLGTFVGGFQAFFDALARHVQARGARIYYRARARALHHDGHGWHVLCEGCDLSEMRFDLVLVTTSPRVLVRLVPQLPQHYTAPLAQLVSLGAVSVIFALSHPLSPHGHYWHNLPKSAGFPFLALCEHTHFANAADFGGQHLVYCGDYLPPEHEYFAMTEEELRRTFEPALARINPRFSPAWVQDYWVFREAYAQPVPFVNHSQHLPPLHTPLPGLFFASMSHVYPWDRGTNYAVRLGREVARAMMLRGRASEARA